MPQFWVTDNWEMLLPTNILRYLKGMVQIAPPVQHRFLAWNLSNVLQVLMRPLFEPLYPIECLTWKIVLLLLLLLLLPQLGGNQSWRLFWFKRSCYIFPDSVVLRPNPAFLPKVNSAVVLTGLLPQSFTNWPFAPVLHYQNRFCSTNWMLEGVCSVVLKGLMQSDYQMHSLKHIGWSIWAKKFHNQLLCFGLSNVLGRPMRYKVSEYPQAS